MINYAIPRCCVSLFPLRAVFYRCRLVKDDRHRYCRHSGFERRPLLSRPTPCVPSPSAFSGTHNASSPQPLRRFLALQRERLLLAQSLSPLAIPLRGNLESPGPAARAFALPQGPWCGAGQQVVRDPLVPLGGLCMRTTLKLVLPLAVS